MAGGHEVQLVSQCIEQRGAALRAGQKAGDMRKGEWGLQNWRRP